VLFLPYTAGEIAALRSVISAWMRLGIFEAMDCGESDQRLWFVIDELDALGEIDGLKDALARVRKFGGRCILGLQSIAQVSGTYGKGTAETIVENCG
jgi:type IV secretory pathway TraG/TraD family ATPase VirD4